MMKNYYHLTLVVLTILFSCTTKSEQTSTPPEQITANSEQVDTKSQSTLTQSGATAANLNQVADEDESGGIDLIGLWIGIPDYLSENENPQLAGAMGELMEMLQMEVELNADFTTRVSMAGFGGQGIYKLTDENKRLILELDDSSIMEAQVNKDTLVIVMPSSSLGEGETTYTFTKSNGQKNTLSASRPASQVTNESLKQQKKEMAEDILKLLSEKKSSSDSRTSSSRSGGGGNSSGGRVTSAGQSSHLTATWELVSIVDGRGAHDKLMEGLEMGTRFIFYSDNTLKKINSNRDIKGNYTINGKDLKVTTELGREQAFSIDKIEPQALVLKEKGSHLIRHYVKVLE